MKVLSVVGDTPGWTYISEIFHEMLPASTRETIRHPELAAEKTKASLEPILLDSPIWISISAFVSDASIGILAGFPRQGSVKTMILTVGIPLTMWSKHHALWAWILSFIQKMLFLSRTIRMLKNDCLAQNSGLSCKRPCPNIKRKYL